MTPETLLYRQIHQAWDLTEGLDILSFRPTTKDKRLLSVHYGDGVTAEQVWEHFVAELENEENASNYMGTLAVTVEECRQLNLPIVPDDYPEGEEPVIRHASIDFTGLTKATAKLQAERLQRFALARGWLYRQRRGSR